MQALCHVSRVNIEADHLVFGVLDRKQLEGYRGPESIKTQGDRLKSPDVKN